MRTADPDTHAVLIDGESLTIDAMRRVAELAAPVDICESAVARVARSRALLEILVERNIPVPGVTTGLGATASLRVDPSKEVELQTNLVRSHSAGVGPMFAEDEARAVVAARLNTLAKGHSAVRPEILDRLALYLNEGVTPAIPEIGSLGAGGDLTPLAHVASTLISEGHVLCDGRRQETGRVLRELGVPPLRLRFKEGLALITGTSAMAGLGSLVVGRAFTQVRQAEIVSALLNDVLCGSTSPFLAEGHDVAQPHRGQVESAANMRLLLEGGGLPPEHTARRREPRREYTLRAVPQILGAVRDTLRHAKEKLEIELNSANDDPLFFESGEIFHGANFHGQSIAFAMDFVTIALTQLGVLAERQVNRVLDRHLSHGLPEGLVAAEPGVHRGFAGAGCPATALVAENRTIGPASVQSVPSGGDHQDVVSVGLIAARNARRVLQNNDRVLAVTFLATAQAVDVSRRYESLSPASRTTYDAVRSLVPALGVDRSMAGDIELVAAALSRGEFLGSVAREEGIALR
ncbi:tyrosine 2,3-aminomutase [Streptomyces sp. NPDC096046]|uniref:tyrosine 2,3-aminomutase n=1 Tax=Streptomyces sp. NPDC096046 TaxID=3155542 RepID=UPI0033223E66